MVRTLVWRKNIQEKKMIMSESIINNSQLIYHH